MEFAAVPKGTRHRGEPAHEKAQHHTQIMETTQQQQTTKTARIFEDVGGYYVCPSGKLDARGHAHKTKASALRSAVEQGYTHATGSGTYWDGVRSIPPGFAR